MALSSPHIQNFVSMLELLSAGHCLWGLLRAATACCLMSTFFGPVNYVQPRLATRLFGVQGVEPCSMSLRKKKCKKCMTCMSGVIVLLQAAGVVKCHHLCV